MQKWEYCTLRNHDNEVWLAFNGLGAKKYKPGDWLAIINQLGDVGWEAVSDVVSDQMLTSRASYSLWPRGIVREILLKRPKE